MSTTTTRLGLVKETTAENYSVGTVNANSDKVDAAVGFEQVTSSTRPSAPFNGKGIRETDTGSVLYSNGGAPASGSWKYLWTPEGPVIVGAVGSTAPLRGETTSTLFGNRFLDARKQGETQPGFTLDFDGTQRWGPGGSTAPDVNLFRAAADTLRTDDHLVVGGSLNAVGAAAFNGSITATGAITADAVNRLTLPYLHVYQVNGSTQSISNITPTPVTFTAEIVDNINCHSTSSNTSRYTPNVPGKYKCWGQVVYAASGTTFEIVAQFRKNGSVVLGAAPYGPVKAFSSAFVAMAAQCVGTFDMNGTTDYIELYTNQNSGGSLNTFSNTTDMHSFMIIERVAA
jgi:hypothetical protein